MVRVALAQFSGHESKEINLQKAEDLARQAAGQRRPDHLLPRALGLLQVSAAGRVRRDPDGDGLTS